MMTFNILNYNTYQIRFTKNRNNPWNFSEEKFNRGPNRPQNKDKAYFKP